MDADRRNDTGIFRYTDVEYTPEGHTDAYRWDDFLGIAGGHVYSAMDTIDMVSMAASTRGMSQSMPMPAKSSGVAVLATESRCSARCPTTGRT